MNDSSHTPDQGQIINSKAAIFQKWNCAAVFKARQQCELLGLSNPGYVYVFALPNPLAAYPMSKQCFAWRGVAFDPKRNANAEVVVLDIEIPEETESVSPQLALWAWWTNDLINDKEVDCIGEIGNWTAEKFLSLQNQPVRDQNEKTGRFFVRQWNERQFLIRIVIDGIKYPVPAGVTPEFRLKSIRLTQRELETITEPQRGLGHYYSINMIFPQQ